MPATVNWNRLRIESDSDADFKKSVESELPRFLQLPFPELELDMGACKNLGEASFKIVGMRLVEAAGGRKLLVRVPEDMQRYFEGSGLSSLLNVAVIEHMLGPIVVGEDGEADSLEPAEDDEPAEKDETHPPSGDSINNTKVQVIAKYGALVDAEDGRRYPIGDEITIGREPPSEPAFAIPTISKRHFRLFRQGPGYFIEDLRSTNGTYLNGNPLTQPQPLAEADEVVVAITLKHPEGAKRFKFTLKE